MRDQTPPESIVVSLEWAKKLKEAGWPQDDACFFWDLNESKLYDFLDSVSIAAPSAEEILRMLPKGWKCREQSEKEFANSDGEKYVKKGEIAVYYGWEDQQQFPKEVKCGEGDTLANAAAAMFCYLSDNNLPTP